MRIELTLPALERLIGGDSEIEVHIRQQIVEEFAKKHLKTICNDATWKAISAVWRAELDATVKRQLDTLLAGQIAKAEESGLSLARSWTLSDAIEKACRTRITEALEKITTEQSARFERLVSYAFHEGIRAEALKKVQESTVINEAITKMIDQKVEQEVQRRLKIAAETKP